MGYNYEILFISRVVCPDQSLPVPNKTKMTHAECDNEVNTVDGGKLFQE